MTGRRLLVVAMAMMASLAGAQPVSILGGDWVRLTSRPSADDFRCAGYSDVEERWVVSSDGGSVVVQPLQLREHADPLPFRIPAENDRIGDRHVQKVEDGWLVGFDAGEFGGALWWYANQGSRSYRVGPAREKVDAMSAPVQGFARLGSQLLVLRGLDHLTLRSGALFAVARERGRWRLRPFSTLDAQPLGWTAHSSELIVLTEGGIWSVNAQGVAQAVFRFDESWPRPTSMAVPAGNAIFVGMPRYVLELSQAAKGWVDAWHVRAACERAELVDWSCRCQP